MQQIDYPCGGLPMMFCGDPHQKKEPGSPEWHREMMEVALKQHRHQSNLADNNVTMCKGLKLMEDATRVHLTRNMRARGDPEFIGFLDRMRDTNSQQPVADEFVQKLRPLKAADVNKDPSWRFAPVGVLSRLERDTLNIGKLKAFAKHFKLPLVRWKLPLRCGDTDVLDEEFKRVLDDLHNHEENLWGYYVRGAPVFMTANLKSVRKLVNGCSGLLHSLVLAADAAEDEELLEAGEAYNGENPVTLSRPPRAVKLIVGSTDENPRFWHEQRLEDLSDVIPTDFIVGEQVVPLIISNETADVKITSKFAAENRIEKALPVRHHPYELAFALTDFKLQGRTLSKLVISVCKRTSPPHMNLAAIYVLVSRVRSLDGLRLLQHDRAGLRQLTTLKTSQWLYGWTRGYDTAGRWQRHLAAKAVLELRARRNVRDNETAQSAAPAATAAAPAAAAQSAAATAAAAAAAAKQLLEEEKQREKQRRQANGGGPAPGGGRASASHGEGVGERTAGQKTRRAEGEGAEGECTARQRPRKTPKAPTCSVCGGSHSCNSTDCPQRTVGQKTHRAAESAEAEGEDGEGVAQPMARRRAEGEEGEGVAQPMARRLPQCSACRAIGHTRASKTCPHYQQRRV